MPENIGTVDLPVRPSRLSVTCRTWIVQTGRVEPGRTYTTLSQHGPNIVLSGNAPVKVNRSEFTGMN